MKKLLQLQVLILLMFSTFTANGQIDTLKTIANLSNADGGHGGSNFVYNDTLYFIYNSAATGKNYLAKFNGVDSFSLINNPNTADLGFNGSLIVYQGALYGTYSNAAGKFILAKYDGTGVTTFANPAAGTGLVGEPTIYNGFLYYSFYGGTGKTQLAKFDGTAVSLISNPDAGNGLEYIVKPVLFNNNLYYAYNNSAGKRQLAKFNGTSLTQIANPDAGGGYATNLYSGIVYNNLMYIEYGNQSNSVQLASFDGSTFSLINNINTTDLGVDGPLTVYNNEICFAYKISNVVTQLARYNGTAVSAVVNPDAGQGYIHIPSVIFKNALYCIYQVAGTLNYSLCKYDGNSLTLISDTSNPNSYVFSLFTGFDSSLCLIRTRAGFVNLLERELALYDGTSIKRIANANTTDMGPIGNFAVYKNRLYLRNIISYPNPMSGLSPKYNLAYITASIASQGNVICNGGNDGWAKVTPPPCGAGANTYLWTPGNQTTDSIGGLSAGNYSVRIICGTDTINHAFTITQPAAVTAPTAVNQSFCGTVTVADLTATGTNIKWYAAASGGSPLVATTVLTDGTKYYASQTINGCESAARAADSVTVSIVAAPGTSNQSFCNSATVADLIANGTTIKWYLTPTGGSPLTATTALSNGTKYYASQTTGSCESAVRAVDSVTINNTAAPTTTGSLVVYTGNKTISQLDVTPLTGGTVNYYYAATGGTALAGTTAVVDDTTYYVSQTVNGCESTPRKQIKVNRIANDSIVLCNPATVADLTATPQTGNTAQWFTSATGGTALASTTSIPTGTNTLYVEEGRSGTDTIARIAGTLFGVNFNTITVLARGENDTIYFGTIKGDIYRANPDGSDTVKIKPGTQQINWAAFRKEGAARFLYYTLYAGNDIKKLNLATGAVTTLGSGFFGPRQINFDDANNRIFIADAENYKIKMLNTATNAITVIDSFPGVFPTSILRPFAVYYHAGLNKLFFSNLDQGKIYSKDLSSLTNPKVQIATVSSVSSISLLPNGKLLLAGGDRIYTLNTDGTGQTTLYSGLYGSNNPFYNNSNLLTYNTHTKVVREALINSNRVPVTVIVNPTPSVTATADKVVCKNSAVAAVNFSTSSTGGTVTYSWTNNNTNIGLVASGTGDISSFTAVNNGTSPDTATIIVTPAITNGGVSCVGAKDTFYIVVNPEAIVNPITDKVLCNGASFTAVTPTSTATGGTVSYTWTNNTPAIGLAASGSGNVPAFTALNNGTAPVTATVIVTPVFSNGGTNCAGIADTFLITVNPAAAVNAVSNQVLCNNAATTAINFSSTATGGTIVYNWTNNTPSIGLAASGTGNIAAFNAVNNGNAPVTATITVIPSYTNAGVTCTGTATTFTYTVNSTAVVNAVTSQVICNGAPATAVTFGSPTTGGAIVYNWTNNTTSIGLAASGTGNIAAFNAVNNGTAPVTATITVTPSYTNAGVTCTGTPGTFTITVNPTATVTAVNSQVICNGSPTTAVTFSSPATGGTIVYNWTNNATSIGLAASGTGNIASFNAINNGTAPVVATITVTPSYTNAGVTCTGTPSTFTYTVNPTASVNAVANQVLCNNSATTAITFSSPATGGSIVYNWTNNSPSIGLAATGSGNIASFNAMNTGTAPVTATITVTPTFTNAGVSCTGVSQTFNVTVNPTAVVNTVSNQTVCADVTNSSVSFSSPVAGTTYSWTNSNPSVGLAASGTGTVPSFTALNASPNAINATITVTPNTAAGCIGQSITYIVTVNGKSVAPTSINNPTPIVCANNAFATLTVNGGALGTGATWKWYADSLNTISIGSGFTLSNIAVAKTTTYFVRAEGTCNNTTAASVVVQRANLVHHVRQHWSDVLLFDNSSNNYVAWQWYKNGVAVTGAVLQQYSENTALAGTYYVVATDKNGVQFISCPLTITAGSFTGLRISLFPNPADKGANVTVSTSFTVNDLVGASITITDVFGRVVRQIATVAPNTTIQAPTATGMYIVTLTLQNGMKYSANLLTK